MGRAFQRLIESRGPGTVDFRRFATLSYGKNRPESENFSDTSVVSGNRLLTPARRCRMKVRTGAHLRNLAEPASSTGTSSSTEALMEVSQRRAYACYPAGQGTSRALS